ncbi:MAG: hypothetical protein OEY49_13630 [Candidatus Heimdallarchaeota archaeon]|nr:hypothetical protein [Candidatus Heimdallarchaeota archaeon]
MKTSEGLEIFRAYDIRGIFGENLSVETMLNIGRAFGSYLIKKHKTKITIGGDIRASTPILLNALISGVSSTGIHCDLVEKSPLGITLFQSFINKYDASAFITASHLPPEWNGVKFYWGEGIGFSPEENDEIKDIFLKKDFINKNAFEVGQTTKVDPYNSFVTYLKSKFEFKTKYKIAIDCGNGATSLVVPKLYEDLGFEVESIFSDPDPRFPNRSSEPTEESLSKLSEFMKKGEFDFGAGFDGDGDRCVFIDNLGNFVSSDTFGILVAEYLVKTSNNNSILINMECSLGMEVYLREIGAKIKRIRVGHSFLSLEAKLENAIFGVESSGHAIYPEVFLFDDALILPLLLAKAIHFKDDTLSNMNKNIKLPIKRRFDLKCNDNTKFAKMNEIDATLRNEEGEILDIDGISLKNDNGRILVRVSNTSPKIRVTIEALNQTDFEILEQKYLPIIKEIIGE